MRQNDDRPSRGPLAWGVVAALAVALVLLLLTRDLRDPWNRAGQIAGVAGLLLAVIVFALTLADRWSTKDARTTDPIRQLDDACMVLARQVRQQWQREASTRGLLRPKPLRARWSSTVRDVAAPAEQIVGGTVIGRPTRLKLHGDVTDVMAAWRHLPARQLVIIGEPGAGKTSLAVLLVLGLLDDPVAGEPVPVLFTISDWNPGQQELDRWLAGRLAAQYAMLSNPARFGRAAALRLVEEGRVLPVLDGLDEMSPERRQQALLTLGAVGGDRSLVLTCRAAEYEHAVRALGTPLARAAVVEIEPFGSAEVAGYLPTGQIEGKRRWRPVVDELRAHPAGELAQALSTPLMVHLARTVYAPQATEPAKLTTTFRTRREIEEHLLEQYLPAVYAARPAAPGERLYRCSPEQARRWMTFLAHHLRDNVGGTTNLAWWDLRQAVSPWVIGLILALVPGLAIGIAAAAGPRLGIGLGVGLLVGLAGAVAARLWLPLPRRWRNNADLLANPVAGIGSGAAGAVTGAFLGGLQATGTAAGATKGLVGAVGVGLAVGPVGGVLGGALAGIAGGASVGLTAGAGAGTPAGIVDGVAGGLAAALVVILAGRRTPARGLRWLRWSPLAAAAGLVAGVGLGVTAGPLAGLIGTIAGLCLGLLGADINVEAADGPRAVLQRDRSTFLISGLAAGATVLGGASLAVLPVVGAAGGITVGLVFGCLRATWGIFLLARSLLALRGRLPWRLMSFLADAHTNRGLLRQVGATYQFRHADLQRHLAGEPRIPASRRST